MPSVNVEAVPNYSRMLRLDGQAFVLLGAGQGIGKHVAHALAQSGARLLCVDSDADRAHAVAALTESQPYVADITKRTEMQGLFQHAQVQFGSDLKGLVDVVGMVGDGGLHAKEDRPWRRQFELVLDHAWLALQYGASAMASQGGSMVFIGSEAGNLPRTGTRLPYSAAKAALHHLVRGAALELAPQRIRVNVVAPGLTMTPRLVQAAAPTFWEEHASRIPLGRVASPEDVAASVLFLSSPLASHITGVVLSVDGGNSLVVGSPA